MCLVWGISSTSQFSESKMHCNVYTLGSGVRLSMLDFWLSYDAKTTYGAHCYYFPAFPKLVQSQAILKTLDNNSNKLRKAGVPPLHQSHTMGVKGLGQEATQVLLPWKPSYLHFCEEELPHTHTCRETLFFWIFSRGSFYF